MQKFEQDMANMEVSVTRGVEDADSSALQGKQIRLEATRPEPIIEHIVPEKWFCLLAKSIKYQDYGEKEVQMFINFEWSERIGDPSTELVCSHSGPDHDHDHDHDSSLPTTGTQRPGEHHYRVPYVLDRVYKSKETTIFDFVVGRKAMRWARKQSEFLNVLVMTAVEALEETYSEMVDRSSLTVSSSVDYKLSPDFEAKAPSTSEKPKQEGPTPYFERKLASLSGTERIPQAKTGLTALQRDMLVEHLTLPQSTLFQFMKLTVESSFHPTLKMTIPTFSIQQNERNVTLQFNLSLPVSCIKWTLFHSSLAQKTSSAQVNGPQGVDTASEHESSPVSVFELFCDNDSARHALCLPLFAKIDSLQSYGTVGGDKVVFVLRKESVASWPSILANSAKEPLICS